MSDIKPALTAEEWANGYDSNDLLVLLRSGGRVDVTVDAYPLGGRLGDPRDLQALAAFCLCEQPFGFRREDMIMHREAAHACITGGQTIGPGSMHRWHTSMAERLEALLPPEQVTFTDCRFMPEDEGVDILLMKVEDHDTTGSEA